jgi:membrane protein DedA with SNARE-associated domain
MACAAWLHPMTGLCCAGLALCVLAMGCGIPGLGDAALVTAGTLAGTGRLDIWAVASVAMGAWMLGAPIGYLIGRRGGRALIERPGPFAAARRRMLAKGERAFARHSLLASAVLPSYLSGIFRARARHFASGAAVSGTFWVTGYLSLADAFGPRVAAHAGEIASSCVLPAAAAVVVVLVGRAQRRTRRARQAAGGTQPLSP